MRDIVREDQNHEGREVVPETSKDRLDEQVENSAHLVEDTSLLEAGIDMLGALFKPRGLTLLRSIQ